MNPLADDAATDPLDSELVTSARAGSRESLEQLITRHQAWIYNIARRMLYNPLDAEDATQEILIKVITKLGAFESRSSFRTWLYRIVVNHLLNMKRGRSESGGWDFAKYAQALDAMPDADIPDATATPADAMLLVDEAKIVCTSGMLLCLDREPRLIRPATWSSSRTTSRFSLRISMRGSMAAPPVLRITNGCAGRYRFRDTNS